MRLALIAHDNKKVDLVAWATFNRDLLACFELTGTGHSARLVREKVGLEIEALLSGPEGGDAGGDEPGHRHPRHCRAGAP